MNTPNNSFRISQETQVESEIEELESQLRAKRKQLEDLQTPKTKYQATFSDDEDVPKAVNEEEFQTDSRWNGCDSIQIKIDGVDRVVRYDGTTRKYKWRGNEYSLQQVRRMHPKRYNYKPKN